MKADLHIHSTVSDGSMTRKQICELAKKQEITHIAFADHDCTFDYENVSKLGDESLKVIPAIEISSYDYETNKKVHILGYDYKKSAPLEKLCSPILQRRNENCLKQIEILSRMGYVITEDRVRKYAGKCIYKQHILKYLYESGQSKEIFGKIYNDVFKHGGVCDFDIEYADCVDAVKAVKAAGGYAVLAHAGQQKNYSTVRKLKDAGLDGIELFHPSNNSEAMNKIIDLSNEYDLFCTGGSDFHGEYEREYHPMGEWFSPENPIVKQN